MIGKKVVFLRSQAVRFGGGHGTAFMQMNTVFKRLIEFGIFFSFFSFLLSLVFLYGFLLFTLRSITNCQFTSKRFQSKTFLWRFCNCNKNVFAVLASQKKTKRRRLSNININWWMMRTSGSINNKLMVMSKSAHNKTLNVACKMPLCVCLWIFNVKY